MDKQYKIQACGMKDAEMGLFPMQIEYTGIVNVAPEVYLGYFVLIQKRTNSDWVSYCPTDTDKIGTKSEAC